MNGNPAGRLEPGRLILIRHGETEHNAAQRICGWTDVCLSARGQAQAERLSRHVAAYRIERLYTSPLQRAWLTAQAIAARTGLSPEPVDDLREINFGQLEGLELAVFARDYPELYARWRQPADLDLHWPGGESRAAFRERVRRVFTPLEAESRVCCVAVVCHGGVIGSYLAQRLAGDAAAWRDFAVRNCSVTELAWQGEQPVLITFDAVDHLAEE